MPRGDRRSLFRNRSPSTLRAWLMALGVALGLSLLPSRFLVGWTVELADFANVVLIPPKHLASSVRHWLRPAPDPLEAQPDAIRALTEELERSRDRAMRLELEREVLMQRIALLEQAKLFSGAGDLTRTRYGAIVSVTLPTARSVGSLQLNVGEMHGVTPGMIATSEGNVFIGRVAESVQRFSSSIIPSTGLSGFAVSFTPPDREIPLEEAPRGVLTIKDGVWSVDLTRPGEIAVGWVARVAEERWPRSALGLRVGLVDSVQTRDDAPLMRRISVRPIVDPFRLAHVVLTDEALPESADAPGGRP